ncbi:unnamed protein product [Angiostrongylus costaricensis]|uniref:Rho-GAP domain-containing protein n=1 Tax=Angiostrongylus costaricensis TaxID=334426 RepID=A0A0R3PDN1_ANGCS|nr:unnamed protein product [Angiostrongylus costaricensis]
MGVILCGLVKKLDCVPYALFYGSLVALANDEYPAKGPCPKRILRLECATLADGDVLHTRLGLPEMDRYMAVLLVEYLVAVETDYSVLLTSCCPSG